MKRLTFFGIMLMSCLPLLLRAQELAVVSGTVQAQGEQVQQVLTDGEEIKTIPSGRTTRGDSTFVAKAFTHRTGSNYYDYVNSNVLQPYAMVTFVYTIR